MSRLGVFPGAFNPVTVAHLALAEAALSLVDEVVFVLPRIFPHKSYTGASFDERMGMLIAAASGGEAFSVAAVERGLFIDIASACRQAYGEPLRVSFLCGADAAERVATWDSGDAGAVEAMARQFDLLVAARKRVYAPLEQFRNWITPLPLNGEFHAVSATDVRARIAEGLPWEHLVPEPAREAARRIYRRARTTTASLAPAETPPAK